MLQSYFSWLNNLSVKRRYLPILGIVIYVLVLSLCNILTPNHLKISLGLFAIFYSGPRLQKLTRFALPLLCVAVVYDLMKYIGPHIRGDVHVAWPYETEKRLFGVVYRGQVLTPNEFLKFFQSSFLDFYTGTFYFLFIPIHVVLNFIIGRHAANLTGDENWGIRMNWIFFYLNLMGYVTYYIFPAAPPWYVELYGLGPANIHALPNAAGCARYDSLLGIQLFKKMYANSSEVFGAIPSLHVAYPALNVFFAFKFKKLRTFAVAFSASMCFAAVYLNHHYIIDVLWGLGYAVILLVAFSFLFRHRQPHSQL